MTVPLGITMSMFLPYVSIPSDKGVTSIKINPCNVSDYSPPRIPP
jgi:hypothetical protein